MQAMPALSHKLTGYIYSLGCNVNDAEEVASFEWLTCRLGSRARTG